MRPLVAVILCGVEGAMQRALLCSEDWSIGTMYRETILRMETGVRDKMDAMTRVRLGLKRGDNRPAIENPKAFKVQKEHWLKRLGNAIAARV